jgi:endogenous inhibitor of DNA gyrase (YacG/DUF329 family)
MYYLIPDSWIDYTKINKPRGKSKRLESDKGLYVYSKSLIKFLKRLGYSSQNYYDRWVLNITVPSDRPICPICGKYTRWKGKISHGYHQYCSLKCSQYDLWNGSKREEYIPRWREGMREFNESGGAFGIIHKNLDKYPKYTEAINSEEAKEKHRISAKKKIENGVIKTFGVQLKDANSKLYNYLYGPKDSPDSIKSKMNTLDHKEAMSNLAKSRRLGFGYLWDHPEILKEDSDFGNNHRFENGTIESSKCVGRCYYRSSYERKYIEEFIEPDENIVSYEIEPNKYKVRYYNYNSGTICTYYPDFVLYKANGSIEIIEVKPWNLRNTPNNKSKRREMKRFCKMNGYKYRLITEKDLKIGKYKDE